MAASLGRSTWKGHLRVSLVSIPVKAYTAATSGGGEIHLNQLHRDCHHRIRYRKTCPVHGEVSGEEIVSGYEYGRGQSVVVQPEELDHNDVAAERREPDACFIAQRSLGVEPDWRGQSTRGRRVKRRAPIDIMIGNGAPFLRHPDRHERRATTFVVPRRDNRLISIIHFQIRRCGNSRCRAEQPVARPAGRNRLIAAANLSGT